MYLEAALRSVRDKSLLDQQLTLNLHVPFEIAYADDIGFVRTSQQWPREDEYVAEQQRGQCYLKVNRDKTEYMNIVCKSG